jgi:hypothetical protein
VSTKQKNYNCQVDAQVENNLKKNKSKERYLIKYKKNVERRSQNR